MLSAPVETESLTRAVADSHGLPVLYTAPGSEDRLMLEGDQLVSGDGAHAYSVVNGIPRLLTRPRESSPAEEANFRKLNDLARARGWRHAIEQIYRDDPKLIRYVTDPNRAIFIDLLGLEANQVVLEIGPGLGQFTPLMAARARTVFALEVVPGQAELAATRCAQEGFRNVEVACGGDGCLLPYPAGTFDAIVCNLVFEWCASRRPQERPEAGQRQLLREFARVLKGGGLLYLATKNRFALELLLGGRDEHAHGIRFGHALPKWLLDLMLKLRGKDRPEGVLYSHRELWRLIARAGFSELHSYWAAPEMRFPQRYIPTDARSIRQARREGGFAQGHRRLTRWIMPWIPASLVRHFTPGLVFVGRKNA